MKQIGIVTIIDNDNYGNRLQNYALSKYLEDNFKIDSITLLNNDFSNNRSLYFIRKIKNKFFNKRYNKNFNKERQNNFENFNMNIKFSKKTYSCFSNLNNYDFIIVGSDQVWNPNFRRLRDFDILKNVTPSKRISYAASFGVSNIEKKYKNKLKEIEKFKAISVRENTGKEIIQNYTKKQNVNVLIDPTLLLTDKEWNNIIKKPKIFIPKKYILNYFLGELNYHRRQIINNFATKNNCEVINLYDKNSPFYKCGPSEFLYLIKNAYLICTDSFHSCVFSLIYNKSFVIFEREQNNMKLMNDRIETLLNKFDLKNRKFNGKKITKNNINHNYSKAFKTIEIEKEKSKLFLKEALEIKDSD